MIKFPGLYQIHKIDFSIVQCVLCVTDAEALCRGTKSKTTHHSAMPIMEHRVPDSQVLSGSLHQKKCSGADATFSLLMSN